MFLRLLVDAIEWTFKFKNGSVNSVRFLSPHPEVGGLPLAIRSDPFPNLHVEAETSSRQGKLHPITSAVAETRYRIDNGAEDEGDFSCSRRLA